MLDPSIVGQRDLSAQSADRRVAVAVKPLGLRTLRHCPKHAEDLARLQVLAGDVKRRAETCRDVKRREEM